ncbi:pentatricopeptide repeat-containing protein At5g13270, chloroplastic-like [Coffea eugenioides]|uniref:pentatricopeptide repeat-containing protein At5g13270, chloroplastic-like n=1 Tax=Coffea eugenioides TaxID=49369 RepID=UPI000F609771|nr:pentatricopeptide repeat-containing protein At5g13270, chloroplastic-like [Coffea eugenioides]
MYNGGNQGRVAGAYNNSPYFYDYQPEFVYYESNGLNMRRIDQMGKQCLRERSWGYNPQFPQCAMYNCGNQGRVADIKEKRSIIANIINITLPTLWGSWETVISAYADKGWIGKALEIFSRMMGAGINAGPSIYIYLFRALSDLELGKQIRCLVVKSGFDENMSMNTALLSAILGFTQAERQHDALRHFDMMLREDVELDELVFSIILKACAGLVDVGMGQQVHGLVVKLGLESEVSVGTPLVDFYVKCANLDCAIQAFEKISEPNDVTGSAMITGYSQGGEFGKCFRVFRSLRSQAGALNEYIYTSIFQACAALADLNLRTQAHRDAIKRGLISYLHGKSTIISMYAKCGQLDCAFRVFESISDPDTVAWTSMIAACAYHGNAPEALIILGGCRLLP